MSLKESVNLNQCYLRYKVSMGHELQDVKPQVWLDKIWNKYIQYMSSSSSSLCIDWSWTWIFRRFWWWFSSSSVPWDVIGYFPLISMIHTFFSLCWKLITGCWIWYYISDIRDCKVFFPPHLEQNISRRNENERSGRCLYWGYYIKAWIRGY